jgi:hypothetical protein
MLHRSWCRLVVQLLVESMERVTVRDACGVVRVSGIQLCKHIQGWN